MRSKLPRVGTTIFTTISRRAVELGAVNLGQGFPDYDIDPRLTALVAEAMRAGHNQYAPMPGLPALREQIARKLRRDYAQAFDPEGEITVTLGATEALFSAVQALAATGDEVLVFDPVYDSYEPAIELAGARCIHVPLAPPLFPYDWDRIEALITPRTRALMINSPQNPSCTCLTPADMTALAALVTRHDLFVIADEVYEHVVFDGARHQSVLAAPGLRERSVAVFSFGKTLHATGLRIGYAVAPPAITSELRKVHQYNTFTIPTALQHAIAGYLAERPDCGLDLAAFFQGRRDFLRQQLEGSGFAMPVSCGSYFQLIDYGGLSQFTDVELAELLLTQAGVATIPLSVFYREPPRMTLLRVCFAKREATLAEGAEKLRAFAARASEHRRSRTSV
jgi:methionine aminotransferase